MMAILMCFWTDRAIWVMSIATLELLEPLETLAEGAARSAASIVIFEFIIGILHLNWNWNIRILSSNMQTLQFADGHSHYSFCNIISDYDISNELANYMTTIFDVTFGAVFGDDPKEREKLKSFDDELEAIMDKYDMTFHQLFKQIAIT